MGVGTGSWTRGQSEHDLGMVAGVSRDRPGVGWAGLRDERRVAQVKPLVPFQLPSDPRYPIHGFRVLGPVKAIITLPLEYRDTVFESGPLYRGLSELGHIRSRRGDSE